MKTIYKYPLQLGHQTLKLPVGFEPMSAILSDKGIMLYSLIDPEVKETEDVGVMVSGTGWALDNTEMESSRFIGTVMDNWLVWHIFVLK